MSLTGRYTSALAIALDAHRGQVRKGTDIPYISHPIAVSALVLEYGGDEDETMAALLHDVLEDCGDGWKGVILALCADRVLSIVKGCSDCEGDKAAPKPPWRERKEAYIRHLATADRSVLLVSICDKIHNATCIVEDLENIGVAVFDRFRAGREGTLWYYGELVDAFSRRGPFAVSGPAVARLRALYHRMEALAA